MNGQGVGGECSDNLLYEHHLSIKKAMANELWQEIGSGRILGNSERLKEIHVRCREEGEGGREGRGEGILGRC